VENVGSSAGGLCSAGPISMSSTIASRSSRAGALVGSPLPTREISTDADALGRSLNDDVRVLSSEAEAEDPT
jgi:hypothetical protein